jgi:enediyne biosynthesis protein E4
MRGSVLRRFLGVAFLLPAAGLLLATDVPSPWDVTLVDVAERAGLTRPSVYGGLERKRFIIETNGAGAAFVDLDGDGWVEALVLNGTRLEEGARRDRTWAAGQAPTNHLYRNNRDGTFADVSAGSGLDRTGWASSACVGDYDDDGRLDLFVTYFGSNRLFRNRGGYRFEDVTSAAGLPTSGTRWGSGCSFLDFDRDGRLDLFVSNYLAFDLASAQEPGQGVNCLWKGIPVNCGPKGLPTDTNLLYRNRGDGSFEDVSERSGIARVTGRYPMTAAAADLDGDGWVDLYVACDSTAAIFYRNNRDGTFTDVALQSGIGFSEFGNAQAGMGLAVADYDGDGRLDVLKTHFADDIPALYRNLGNGLFEDTATAAGLAVRNRYVQWGTGLPDLDNDGAADLLYVTGNVYPEIERHFKEYPHRGPRILFRNRGGGVYEDVTEASGPGATTPQSSRGAAFGDYDHDGDVDVLVMNMNERPSLLRNEAARGRHWLKVKLEGRPGNRFGLGATVVVTANGRKQARAVLSQTSYYSVDDLVLHFGLGASERAETVEVLWPSGGRDVARDVPSRQVLSVREGAQEPLSTVTLLDLEGRPVKPLEGGTVKALVFVFVSVNCPIANRYAPELKRLHEAFAPRGVGFRLVYTEREATAQSIRNYQAEYGLAAEALRDPQHMLVKLVGARVTPEAAVFVPGASGGQLVYHGRIDDRYVELGRMRPAPTSRDLNDALEAVLAGRPAPRETAPAIGCFIDDLP